MAAALPGRGQSFANDPPVPNLDDPLRPRSHIVIVRDEDDRRTGTPNALEHVEHRSSSFAIEVPSRLVGKEELWVVRERAGDGYPLAFSAGELARQPMRHVPEADSFEELPRLS